MTMRQSRGRGSKVETEARPCEAEARPSQLKTASRPPRAEADASRTPSLSKSEWSYDTDCVFLDCCRTHEPTIKRAFTTVNIYPRQRLIYGGNFPFRVGVDLHRHRVHILVIPAVRSVTLNLANFSEVAK